MASARSAGILALDAPWDTGFRLPGLDTTMEDVLLDARDFTGCSPGLTGLGAHGETALLLSAGLATANERRSKLYMHLYSTYMYVYIIYIYIHIHIALVYSAW